MSDSSFIVIFPILVDFSIHSNKNCKPLSNWQEKGIRESVLHDFEQEMLERTATKVKDSAAAAEFLHSEIALFEGDEPRGRVLKRGEL